MALIYKYPLEITREQVVSLPLGYQLLHVDTDPKGVLCLWALVRPLAEKTDVCFAIVGTGQQTPRDGTYLGSAKQGEFMWHVFYLTRKLRLQTQQQKTTYHEPLLYNPKREQRIRHL